MKSYADLIKQTFYFPTPEFKVENDELIFNDVPVMDIIREYGTPLKMTYLPKISQNIQKAKTWFANAIAKHSYPATYTYCYCTKSSHFSFVMLEALKNDIHIETSSAYDIPIVKEMYRRGKITKDTFVVCNGFKRPLYTQYITEILNEGYNCVPVLDNMNELQYYKKHVTRPVVDLGIRVAADEEPSFGFYTSRLGIRYVDIKDFYEKEIQNDPRFRLKMLHFFINSGIKDTVYYWAELNRFIEKYCEMKAICPELDTIDIGGGFPIKTSIHFEYDYQYMVDTIVENIKWLCEKTVCPVRTL